MGFFHFLKPFVEIMSERRIRESLLSGLNMKSTLGLPVNAKFLDCGCGIGWDVLRAHKDSFDAYGFDIYSSLIKKYSSYKKGKNIQFLVADTSSIPLKNSSIDVVLSNHVLEHTLNDEIVLKEMNRILKKGGWLLLNVPNINNYATSMNKMLKKNNPYTDPGHKREYNEKEIIEKVSHANFIIVQIERKGFLPPLFDQLFNAFIIWLNLTKLTNYLAMCMPNRCLSIEIKARKMDVSINYPMLS